MPRHQTPAQRETVQRVMHEFKHGELKTARGTRKVKNPKQAVAIALHEAGASKYESPAENKRNLRRTKVKEQRGETYRDEAEGRKGRSTPKSSSTAKRTTVRAKPSTSRASPAKAANGKTRSTASKAKARTASANGQ